MSAIEPLCRLFGINPDDLSKEDLIVLEFDLLLRLCHELKEHFRKQSKNYFFANDEKENTMLEAHLLYLIVQDILATGEYNAEGIARYTDSHEDVIREVYGGRNLDPSARLFRKTIELHSVI